MFLFLKTEIDLIAFGSVCFINLYILIHAIIFPSKHDFFAVLLCYISIIL